METNYLKTATILYVEDEEDIREGYVKALERYSKKLFVATNGQEGLELYEKNLPDIVISDIRMPILDGLSMIKKIKTINEKQIIIITSAHSDINYFLEAISLQVDGYLLKPVDKNILKSKIEYYSKQLFLEKELEQKKIMFLQKEKLASMGEMIGNIAHQWRQPLSVISTSASGLQIEKDNGILTDDSFDKYLNMIINTTQKLSRTLDEFKSFIHQDKQLVKFKISSILEKVFEFQEQGLENNDIEVVFKMDDNLFIRNFPNNFAQSLFNIISNAIDVLCKCNETTKYIFVDLYKKDDKIELLIKDNGGGIDKTILPKIFEAYTTTKHKYVGTGLGLYSTYNILVYDMKCGIEAYNEEFEYKKKKYSGAVFKIILRDNEQ